MKNNVLTIIRKIGFVGITAMVLFGAHASIASAGYSMNSLSNDCRTLSISNYTTGEGYGAPCWTGTSISARDGETFNVALYFNNSGDAPATNVSMRIDDIRGNQSGTVSVRGQLFVNGTAVPLANGVVQVTVPSNSTIEFDSAQIQTQSNTTPRVLSSGTNIFTSSTGLSIGTVNPGWANQGIVKAVFRVRTNGGNSNGTFNVTTDNISNFVESNGDVTLNGHFDHNTANNIFTYFEYQRNNGSVSTTSQQSHGSVASDTASVDLFNLASGSYTYHVCASDGNGFSRCGSDRSFTIDRSTGGCTNNCGGNSILNTTTLSADNVDTDSATLRGSVDAGDYDVDRCWFEYGTSNNLNHTKSVNCSINSNDSENFSGSITGLNDDTEYFFRACTEDTSGDQDCGTTRSFTTDRIYDNNNYNNDQRPDIETLNPIQILWDFVTFDGTYDMNGCSGNTWFDYGTSTSFGSRTTRISRSSNSSGSMNQSVNGLSPNTTYYYRAAGDNCNGTTYGSTRSFRTSNKTTTIIDNNPIVIGGGTNVVRNTTTTITNIGGGASFLRLTITNDQNTVAQGENLAYDVSWENISKQDLKNLVLEISFPDGLQITRTDEGQIDRSANTVYVNIKELLHGEKDSMTVNTNVVGNLHDNDPVTARAIMAFENPINQAQENAIAYDSDTYVVGTSVLGASIFGLGFLPGTLAGWLFVILLLILLILVIRYAFGHSNNNDRGSRGGNGGNGFSNGSGSMGGTTTTYSEAADYTPYRPTPRG